jgi:formylmethanofuran dehydrogenase subunit E
MDDFEILLKKAEDLHGEVCPGMIMGTKMSIAAMKNLDMNPLEPNDNLMVTVEIDRCMPDAIQAITGCTVGRRTLKFNDYGKFVATFMDMTTGESVRVSARDDKSDSIPGLWTWFENIVKLVGDNDMNNIMREKKAAIKLLSEMPEEELLSLEEFQQDLIKIPGLPKDIAVCSNCGEHVMDGKELVINDEIICKDCEELNNKVN